MERGRGGVRPQGIVCFGLLQALDSFRPGANGGYNGAQGAFQWAGLSEATGLHIRTVKRAVRSLVDAGWVALRQKNRLAPIRFTLQNADEAWMQAVRLRVQQGQFLGQSVMQEMLTLIADTRVYTDDGATGFLVNPHTKQLLRFDRYYPLHGVAFEFNGPQHYRPTERYSKDQVAVQRRRDAVKRTICTEEKVNLVIVHAEDLSIDGISRKVGNLLPKRDLSVFPKTVKYLESLARRYREAVARAGKSHRGAEGLVAASNRP